jgi:hypothetical protein
VTPHRGCAGARTACCLLIILSSSLVGQTRAARGESSVALPDTPFVVPLAQSLSAHETGADVLTERSNNYRTSSVESAGLNQSVFKTPGAWRQLSTLPVEGTVYAQPLYAEQVTMASDHRPHNAVFVATAQNNIYAFDADNFAALWTTHLGGNDRSTITVNGTKLVCNSLSGQEGIGTEATPVIDRRLGRMFVSYRLGNEDPTKAEQRLVAIDLSSGKVISTPVEPPAPPQHWPQWNRSRASLLLVDGVIYVAFGSRCEDPGTPQFQGWIIAYDAQSLSRVGAFGPNSEAALDGAGIWQGSVGPAADENGDIYIMTGNRRIGVCNPSPCDRAAPDIATRSESAIRLQTAIVRNAQGSVDRVDISVGDWFTPYRKIWLDNEDLDLGASGLVLIPGTPFLFGGGKEGLIYVLDRDNMGGLDPDFWTNDVYNPCPTNPKSCLGVNDTDATKPDDPNKDRVLQKFQAGKTQDPVVGSPKMRGDWIHWPHIHGAPAFARFSTFAAMYVWPEKDQLKSFRWLDTGKFDTAPKESALPHAPFGGPNLMPGGMISVAVDPTTRDAGVVFASVYARSDGTDGILYAVDPITLQELWSSAPYPFVKYVPPTIARNKVFLAATNEVEVFGVR